jgi:hypothetical protein
VRIMIRLWALAVAATLIAGAFPVRAQSLGELARKEAERRRATGGQTKPAPAGSGETKPAPKKVYTNDDLKPAPSPGAAAPSSAAAAPADQKAKDDKAKKPAEEEKGETYWRNRITQAREELRRNQMFRDALQTRINSLTTDYTSRDDPAQRTQIAADRQKALDELARVTAEIEQTTKQIADIEEEARQAGVPPGWLR